MEILIKQLKASTTFLKSFCKVDISHQTVAFEDVPIPANS